MKGGKRVDSDTDNDGIDTSGDERKKKAGFGKAPVKKGSNYDTDNDGVDTEGEGKIMTSAERRKRRMNYQPPNALSKKSPAARKNNSNYDTDNDGIDTEGKRTLYNPDQIFN